VWAYIEGGMGSVTRALAESAKAAGATIVTDCVVDEILTEGDKAVGVKAVLADGVTPLYAHTILTNANPHHTFTELVPAGALQEGEGVVDYLFITSCSSPWDEALSNNRNYSPSPQRLSCPARSASISNTPTTAAAHSR
jgi:hypothetical protein